LQTRLAEIAQVWKPTAMCALVSRIAVLGPSSKLAARNGLAVLQINGAEAYVAATTR